jgi:aspartyl-tRNA(Asn)/glutamyl-tRNA(Gln) amidotransferase subunit A
MNPARYVSHVDKQRRTRDEHPPVRDAAILRVRDQQATDEATVWDRAVRAGLPEPDLFGTTLIVKACFDVEGWTTDAASKVLANRPAAEQDAPIVKALRSAGAVVVGHSNMTEFAFGALGTNPHHGTPLCPLDPNGERIAGGSTSGGAVAVASGFADIALGTDTSGSVRIPAAFCGVVGFKPSQGRYASAGMIFLSPSFDVPGIIARDVSTIRKVDRALTGDELETVPPFAGRRFLVPVDFALRDADPEVASAFEAVLLRLEDHGAIVVRDEFADLETYGPVAVDGGIIIAEAYAYHREMLAEHPDLYDRRVGPRIALGEKVAAWRYATAKERLRQLGETFQARLKGFDALLMPTVPFLPPRVQDLSEDDAYSTLNRQSFRLTEIANRIDAPSISIPMHPSKPMGLLFTGHRGGDPAILNLALAAEKTLA